MYFLLLFHYNKINKLSSEVNLEYIIIVLLILAVILIPHIDFL